MASLENEPLHIYLNVIKDTILYAVEKILIS